LNSIESKSSRLRLETVVLPVLAVCAACVIFYYGAPVFIPLTVAALTAYTLTPIVEFLKKRKVPHILAVILVMLVLIAVGALLLLVMISELTSLAGKFPDYQKTVQDHFDKVQDYLDRELAQFGGSSALLRNLRIDQISPGAIVKVVFKGAGSLGSLLLSALLLMFMTFFILADYRLYLDNITLLFGKKHRQSQLDILQNIDRQLRGFIMVKIYVTAGMTGVITVVLLLFGIPYPYVWGPFAGILNLIPYVGPIIGAVPPLIVAAINTGSSAKVVAIAAVFLAIQIVESNLITPRLTADKVDLNPLAVMVSSIIWGYLWGAVGVVLAIPITAAIKVLCDNIEALEPIGILLGNKPRK